MDKKIKLGISSCLLGENVRYDAGHKLDHYLIDTLGEFVEWVAVCPEVECGLGVPREAMRLTAGPESPRIVTRDSNIDHTDRMLKWARAKLAQLDKEKLCGFVFKNNSPSCGLNYVLSKKGTGIFAKEFAGHFRHMPVEDEVRLRDNRIKNDFVEKICVFRKARNADKIHER